MSLPVIVLGVYGVLLIAGGAMGYAKAKSKASLIAGSVSGVVALLAAFLANSGKSGLYLGLVLGVAMAVVFGMRLKKTGKFMPAGMLLVVSILVVLLLGASVATAG